jgi:undecaprenyl-diphosphatase
VFTASFPSGHATLSAVVYLTLGVLLAEATTQRSLQVFYIAFAALLVVAIGISRVYLGVHYPTDVLAGWSLGTAWALLCWVGATYVRAHYFRR